MAINSLSIYYLHIYETPYHYSQSLQRITNEILRGILTSHVKMSIAQAFILKDIILFEYRRDGFV